MKKLMIMGAGIYQVPLIKKAKEMGIYTIAVSIPGNYPGFAYADEVCYENTVDYDKILEVARAKQIDGIVTAGTDVAVITIGKVCDELGLTGLSFEAAKIASNKIRMKKKYEEYGVRTARFREVSFGDDMYETAKDLHFPLIFKAVDTSGSRGIIRVNTKDEFEEARQIVKANTRTDYFIIEEFIEGEEFGARNSGRRHLYIMARCSLSFRTAIMCSREIRAFRSVILPLIIWKKRSSGTRRFSLRKRSRPWDLIIVQLMPILF